MLAKNDRVEMRPSGEGKRPVIRGTNIGVEILVRMLGEGATHEDLLCSYPNVSEKDIYAALIYAADVLLLEEHALTNSRAQ